MKEQLQQNVEQENEINGYSLFNEIKNKKLRAYNRCVIASSIKEDHGDQAAANYLSRIDNVGLASLFAMYTYIKENGWETVKKEIMVNHTEEV